MTSAMTCLGMRKRRRKGTRTRRNSPLSRICMNEPMLAIHVRVIMVPANYNTFIVEMPIPLLHYCKRNNRNYFNFVMYTNTRSANLPHPLPRTRNISTTGTCQAFILVSLKWAAQSQPNCFLHCFPAQPFSFPETQQLATFIYVHARLWLLIISHWIDQWCWLHFCNWNQTIVGSQL